MVIQLPITINYNNKNHGYTHTHTHKVFDHLTVFPLRKIKNKLPSLVYSKIYPTGPSPGKFHGTAKLHKVSNNSTVEHLPLRPIIYNIGTATYDLAKYLPQLLKPLSESQYTIQNSKTFTKTLKKK